MGLMYEKLFHFKSINYALILCNDFLMQASILLGKSEVNSASSDEILLLRLLLPLLKLYTAKQVK